MSVFSQNRIRRRQNRPAKRQLTDFGGSSELTKWLGPGERRVP